MSLREQFPVDLDDTFIETSEFATVREFRINDGHGGFKLFTAKVVWDKEMAKQMPIVKVHGVYLADVICYMPHKLLPRMPIAGELIYSPANSPYEVIDITDEESCYMIALSAYRSQPGNYGGN